MAKRIILLRAVNVGGAQLPMARLREIAEHLGATDVSTYIASGNLIADIPGKPEEFDRALEKAIETEFGFFRESISRTPAQVKTALKAHPFKVNEPKYSYVSFLVGEPAAEAIAKAEKYSIGRALKVPGTARNLNTVRKLIELAGS